METSFQARTVVAQNSDGVALVALAETEVGDSHYLVLQRADSEETQDVAAGIDTYYIERDGQQWGCYGGITRIELRPNELKISLGAAAAAQLATDEVRVSFNVDPDAFANLKSQLTHIFSDRRNVALVGL